MGQTLRRPATGRGNALLLHDVNTEFDTPSPGVDAQRVHVRHGFSGIEPDTGERAFVFSRELG